MCLCAELIIYGSSVKRREWSKPRKSPAVSLRVGAVLVTLDKGLADIPRKIQNSFFLL
jgi:hypothetical protein